MPFTSNLPEWANVGTLPPQSLRDSGWAFNQKPPADYFNWFFYTTYKALQELQNASVNTDQLGVANGVATLDPNGKVPQSQLNISAPADATTSVKGIVMLDDTLTSTSTTKAATANAVKQANDNANTRLPGSQKGQPNGVASLGPDAKVPASQLPTIAQTATDITIADATDYYTSANVEGALQELGQTLNGVRASLVATAQESGVM